VQNRFATKSGVPVSTDLSARISKDLSKAGFRFVGPTTVYAFMQAVGMVNDHMVTCPCHDSVARLA
jgi:DNA-3-methyladenine glycosylase I